MGTRITNFGEIDTQEFTSTVAPDLTVGLGRAIIVNEMELHPGINNIAKEDDVESVQLYMRPGQAVSFTLKEMMGLE